MNAEALAARLLQSKAGRQVSPDVVAEAAAWALERYRPKDAEKAAKTRLHQLYGSYVEDGELARAAAIVADLERGELSPPDAAAAMLPLHSSTRERQHSLAACYDAIWAACGAPARVADIACGLNPLSFCALGRTDFELVAMDAGQDIAALLNRFFAATHLPRFCAQAGDALARPPQGRFDVALIMKFLPLCERMARGGARRLLDAVDARHLVVSFPTRTLGGRNVGMEENYAQWFQTLGYPGKLIHSFALSNELFLIVEGR